MARHKPKQSEVALPQRTESKEVKEDIGQGNGEEPDLGSESLVGWEGHPYEVRGGSVMGDELHGRNNQIIDYTKKNVNKLSIREGSFKKKN